jgi:WS/DGAT/MGAT family acyltransferase
MQQLSGTDSFFLHTERGCVYNHVASLGIYDPSTSPEGKVRFKDILRYFSHRLDLSKVFRRRLVAAPHGIDRPYWIEDAEVDLEFHVRHIALPEPGDWRQLMIQVARLHSRPLDRSRPLWEAYVIEGLHRIPGLPSGSFAIFMKFHHAAIDGQAGAELLKAIHSLSAEIEPIDVAPRTLYAEREPNSVELYSRAVAHTAGRALGSLTLYGRTLSKIAGLVTGEVARRANPGVAAGEGAAMPSFVRAPKTRFNRRVSANRVVDAVALPLAAMKSIRAHVEGATINDIFLSVVGGALRRYLEDKGELPETSLMALMPISVRQPGQGADAGNQVGGVPVAIHTDIADPVERLKAVRDGARAAKRSSEALGNDFLKDVMDELPNAVADTFMRYAIYPQLNVTVSNVRGPDVPLYVAGARLVHFYPVSIATDFVGLNHTGFSYNGVLWICTVACRNMLPDPAFYSQCMQGSFDELVAAVDKLPALRKPKTAAAGKRPRAAHKARPAPRAVRRKAEAARAPEAA